MLTIKTLQKQLFDGSDPSLSFPLAHENNTQKSLEPSKIVFQKSQLFTNHHFRNKKS